MKCDIDNDCIEWTGSECGRPGGCRLRPSSCSSPFACSAINIVFDGPPGPEAGRFVEVETDDGNGINIGRWHERDDGMWILRIHELPNAEHENPRERKP